MATTKTYNVQNAGSGSYSASALDSTGTYETSETSNAVNATAYISQITLPSGSVYTLKDSEARTALASLGTAAYKAYCESITGSTNLPTDTAVKTYVDAKVAEIPKMEIVICAASADSIPSGAIYKDGSTTITGTMAASASTMYKIYFVKNSDAGAGAYVEWMTIRSGEEGSYTYAWEQIGTTVADLSNYVTWNSSTNETGAHTHTVSGSVTIPTVSKTSKNLAATASGTAVGADGTAAAITGFGTHPTASVVTGVEANGTANAYTSNTPTNKYFSKGSVTGVSGSTTASKVTGGSVTAGSAASWSATVSDENLTFAWTADIPTAVTLPTADDVTVPVAAASATSVVTGLDTTSTENESVITAIDFGTTSALTGVKASGTADALTGLGTATTADALTGVKVTAQPTITLDGDAASGVAYVDTVTIGSTTGSVSGSAVEAGAHTHTIPKP